MWSRMRARGQRLSMLVVVLLLIELLDELVFGAREATMPLLRDALGLDYVQIGLLVSVPTVIAAFIEPFIGILADTRYRKRIMLIGGIVFTLEILAIILSQNFLALMLSFIVIYPASGAFVSVAQATLMDIEPDRHDQNMARWTLAGSVGFVGGPLMLTLSLNNGIAWQWVYIVLTILSAVMVVMTWRFVPSHIAAIDHDEPPNFREGFRNAWTAIRNIQVLRWVMLLEFSDLMLDILMSFLALYFVDVVGLTPATAAIAVSVWSIVGLVGDFLIIFLLERVDGLAYLRVSAVIELVLYSAFLLVDDVILKVAILAIIGFFNAGWYSVLQGRLYSSLPGQSGIVLFVSNIGGLFGAAIPFMIGAVASQWGLSIAMWLMLLGPLALMIGLPFNHYQQDEKLEDSLS